MISDNEKYNSQVKPNTSFLNELKAKLPEFFDREDNFDLDKFKEKLAEKNINELRDGYQLNFIGKDYARRQAGEMPRTVIVPDKEQNNGEGRNSKNLFFTGDNLEVLRHLQGNYDGKVDVIYIDPPYNTGGDGFVYPDSFEYTDSKLHNMLGLDDDQILRLKSIQGKSSHSAWLTFMYPRLYLAKKLLKTTGKIFISIDDNEMDNLNLLMSELFGETNFMSQVTVVNNPRGRSQDKYIATSSEYLVIYSKEIQKPGALSIEKNKKDIERDYSEYDDNGNYRLLELRNTHRDFGKHNRPNLFYPLYVSIENGNVYVERKEGLPLIKVLPIWNDGFEGCWTWGKDKALKYSNLLVGKKINETIYKIYRKDYAKGSMKQLKSIWNDKEFYTDKGQMRFNKLFSAKGKIFAAPKSDKYIKQIIKMGETNKNDLILDFFAGSSTTADAVMQLNAEDGGSRRFIMVQLPEPTYTINSNGEEIPTKGGKIAYDAGFKSIDEISRERIRRASLKIKEDNKDTISKDFDGSFKHYRVVKPTKRLLNEIADFDPNGDTMFTNMLDSYSSNALDVKGSATGKDTILTTWLAKDDFSFDAKVEELDIAGYKATVVDNMRLYLIDPLWNSRSTKELLNLLGKHKLEVQSIVLFGYSFSSQDLRELETGINQLDSKVSLIKRY